MKKKKKVPEILQGLLKLDQISHTHYLKYKFYSTKPTLMTNITILFSQGKCHPYLHKSQVSFMTTYSLEVKGTPPHPPTQKKKKSKIKIKTLKRC